MQILNNRDKDISFSITPWFVVMFILLVSFSTSSWGISSVYIIFTISTAALLSISPYRLSISELLLGTMLIIAVTIAVLLAKNYSAIMYSIGPILFYLSQTKNRKLPAKGFVYGDSSFGSGKWFLLIILSVTPLLMVETHPGRFSLYYLKDPNYTSTIIGTALAVVFLMIPTWKRPAYMYLFTVLVLYYFTQSRMLLLASLNAAFTFLIAKKSVNYSRAFVIFLLYFSVIAQFLGVILLKSQFAPIFLDASNLERLTAFSGAVTAVFNNPTFLLSGFEGIELILSQFNLVNVPHNWFMMSWLSNGLFVTLLLFYILMKSILKCDVATLPIMAFLVTCAAILGRSLFFAPLIFLTISFWCIKKAQYDVKAAEVKQ